ncbi:MAG: LamG domain-containing protein [Armatimonadota bacterium]
MPETAPRADYGVNAMGRISPRGLVAAWRGDGSALDRAGQSSGTAYGGVTYGPAMVGRGFYLNGSGAGIAVPDTEALRLSGSLTISAWIYIESFPTLSQKMAMIVFRGDDREGRDPFHLEIDALKRVRFQVEASQTDGADVSAPIGAGRFVLVTATLDHTTGRMRLYQNGRVVAETKTKVTPLKDLDPGQNPGIGIGNHGGWPRSGIHYPFHGMINEVLIYNRALSAMEVSALYEDRTVVPSLTP